jgi:hypothetical protein
MTTLRDQGIDVLLTAGIPVADLGTPGTPRHPPRGDQPLRARLGR